VKIMAVIVVASALLPHGARAQTVVSGDVLGRVEATLAFCTQVDPAETTAYQSQGRLMLGDLNDTQVAEIRDSAGYKESYESTRSQLDAIAKDKALVACRQVPK
jgi:hypothetical protein